MTQDSIISGNTCHSKWLQDAPTCSIVQERRTWPWPLYGMACEDLIIATSSAPREEFKTYCLMCRKLLCIERV